jgi:hypothetical protein
VPLQLTSCPPLALQLPVIFLMREINFEDPTNLFFVRVAFGSVAALSAMTLYYMYTRIQSKADGQRKIMVPPPATPSWGAAAEYASSSLPPPHAAAVRVHTFVSFCLPYLTSTATDM